MREVSFSGGIHPPHSKVFTEAKPTVVAEAPKTVFIPLRQHIGAPTECIVKPGARVLMGEVIAEPKGFVSIPIHSSISGTVKKILEMDVPGGRGMCVEIENDFMDELHPSVCPKGTIDKLEGKEIIEIIKNAGIVGMGGAGFPLHVKLSPPPEKTIDTVILNGAECEPFLTADHRLMLESPEKIFQGLKLIMKAVGVTKGYIGIENNKPECQKVMNDMAKFYPDIEVLKLKTKYPQGAEKQLINAVTGREVPSGGLPMDVGCVVNNVATAVAVAEAVLEGMPLIKRICTITGTLIKEPKNMWIRVGTMVDEIVAQCGGYTEHPGKIIMGGPMMGLAQYTDHLPSTKTTSGILVFDKKDAKIPEATNCIKCCKCVDICPARLQPLYISAYCLNENFSKAEEYGAMDCIECGSCSYICPAKRPLLQSIRLAKRTILENRKKSK